MKWPWKLKHGKAIGPFYMSMKWKLKHKKPIGPLIYVYDVWNFCKENCQNPINFINYSYHNYYCQFMCNMHSKVEPCCKTLVHYENEFINGQKFKSFTTLRKLELQHEAKINVMVGLCQPMLFDSWHLEVSKLSKFMLQNFGTRF